MMKGITNWIAFSVCIGMVYSCNSKKYITEIPYQYSSDDFSNSKDQEKEESTSQYSIVDDNSQGLSDDILRIKEKYSIIMGLSGLIMQQGHIDQTNLEIGTSNVISVLKRFENDVDLGSF